MCFDFSGSRVHGDAELRALLSPWPLPQPPLGQWVRHVNEPLTAKELKRLEECQKRSRPYGQDRWQARTVAKLGLEHTLRPRGRPRQRVEGAPHEAG